MAFALIAEPGTKYGPCVPSQGGNGVKLYCGHKDCAQSRTTATSVCIVCGAAIGYMREYCQDDEHDGRYVHYWCAVKRAEKAVR